MYTTAHPLPDSLPIAVLNLDKDGFIVYANLNAGNLTGYTSEELIQKPFSLLYNHDPYKPEYEMEQARKKGAFESEAWRYKKDGSRFWGELILAPISDKGSFNGYTALIRDTSARKDAELEIRQREERFRLMVEGVKEYAIFLLDTGGHIATWNDGARRIKGYLPNEIIGKHFSVFYTSADLETKKPERELQIALKTGKYEEEGWRIRKNGSVFWANIVITALFNDRNELVGFSKVTRDLTERKENEESLKQSEERYRSLVEQVTDYGIFLMDEKGRIINWNAGARRINGYTASEIIGKYFSIFYHEEDVLNNKPAHELEVAKREGKYEEEGWRIRKDGSQFWASIVITAVYDSKGALIGFSKVAKDLTEKKEAEKALRESYERYRLLNEALKGTNAELSYANKELEQFTSIVSHDLQEPIRTIKSFLQLIDLKLNEGQYADLKTYIAKSIAAANRMRELIQNLLHYTQLSKDELVEERIAVTELVNGAIQNLKTAIENTGAQITIQSEIDTVDGDRVQLVQVIQNLLSNALKFTNVDSPEITISCREENGEVKFSVSDNGIGIASADIPKVFEIFRRLHTQKDYPGTGIGLAICKKIVDRHGGKIWPESEEGKGTTFYFTLNKERQNESIA